ncbi:response regulator transcription factor [Flavobacterium sediminilitoris]|uniref:Response regulator transcription factor n=1 Tax=Flavobacterium sediminilitoris TaxID=2024526 RepID=A0ABY4HLY7_9FLAO|nr:MULTISPECIES: response regulator transcription factor [Flavobacterium]UOX33700.1 response regulator transcription factor [Flavobacterium sediminilitoris]
MNKKNISIIIADDHPIMLKGLTEELESAGYNIVATAVNGAAAVEIIASHNPDIALLDIEMPFFNGFEVIKNCQNLGLKTKFVVMTYHKEKGFIVQAKKVGTHGYLLKEDNLDEIESCIKAVLLDEFYFSKSFQDDIQHTVDNELRKVGLLTPSERTIIRLIAQGKNSTEICETLKVSKRTVEKHRANIIAKLELEPSLDTLTQWTNNYKEIIMSL